ncbi:MAG: protein kinase [Gemmatimonadales bacterium]
MTNPSGNLANPQGTVGSLEHVRAALAHAYAVERELGTGGMATVYLAEDLKHRRRVAVKVLTPALASSLGTDRFVQEIGIAARLHHPHILSLHDSGESQGLLYFVMPFVEGESLEARLKREHFLPVEEAVRIAGEVADALDYAHRQSVIHRDIKPGNILLESGHAVVADFGIARAVSEAGGERITSAGIAMGTPSYMSPEQAAGEMDLDGRTDLYSLGCVLYEMLAGEPPFAAPTAMATIARRITEAPPRVSQMRATVTTTLDQLLMKALARVPADRFPTAETMRTALDTVLTDKSTAVDSLAVLPFVNSNNDADSEYLSDGITESIINKLSGVSSLRIVPRTTVFQYKGKDVVLLEAAQRLNVRAIVTGRVMQRSERLIVKAELVDGATDSQLWGDQYHRTMSDIFEVQEDIATEIAKSLRLRLTGEEEKQLARRPTRNTAAYQDYLRGRYHWNKRTAAGFRQATEYFRLAIEQDPEYAIAYAGLADNYNVLGYYNIKPPRDAYPHAIAAAERALALDDSLAEAHASRGFARLFYDRDWPKAERDFKRAMELKPAYPSAHQWYAWYLLITEQFGPAVNAMRRAQELDPLSLVINDHLGYCLLLAGRVEDARKQLATTVDLDPTFPLSHWRLGSLHLGLGDFDRAIAEFQRVVELTETGMGLGYLGQAYAMAGRPDEARAALERLRIYGETQYASPLETALVYDGLGDLDRTFGALERAFEDRISDLSRMKLLPWSPRTRQDPRFTDLVRRLGLPPGEITKPTPA